MAYQPIENYGIIGNIRTAALVGMNGSIDWFCVPFFENQLFLERTSREPSSPGQCDPLIGPKWPSAEHGRFPTEADIDRPAKKEWQSPVKHPRRKCWSADIANGGIP